MRFLILGGGAAAVAAAEAFRNAAPDGEIAILAEEPVAPYRRPALSRMVAAELPDRQFFIKPSAWYDERRIQLHTAVTATAVDVRRRIVNAGGREWPYDRLLFAVGGRANRPPVPGVDGDNVTTYRNRADLLRLRAMLDAGAREFAVIGGGVLALELADALLARGCRVAVIEAMECLLPRQLDRVGGEFLRAQMARTPGLTLHFGVGVAAVDAAGVVLSDGRRIAAAAVVLAAGMRSNQELAQAAGIAVRRGITVDARMATDQPDIFAAGDCAEHDGRTAGLFAPAQAQGRIAGANAAGAAVEYRNATAPVRLNALSGTMFSVGEIGGAGVTAETVCQKDDRLCRLFFRGDRLVGGVLIGAVGAALRLENLVGQHATHEACAIMED